MKKILLGSLVIGTTVLFSACSLQPKAQYSVDDVEMMQQDPSMIEDGNAAASTKPAASVKPTVNSDAAKQIDPAMVKTNEKLMEEESAAGIVE